MASLENLPRSLAPSRIRNYDNDIANGVSDGTIPTEGNVLVFTNNTWTPTSPETLAQRLNVFRSAGTAVTSGNSIPLDTVIYNDGFTVVEPGRYRITSAGTYFVAVTAICDAAELLYVTLYAPSSGTELSFLSMQTAANVTASASGVVTLPVGSDVQFQAGSDLVLTDPGARGRNTQMTIVKIA